MATFRKYAFQKQSDADKVLALCTGTTASVDLGVLDGLVCYDILWEAEAPAMATKYETWPAPCGIHIFAGWEAQYEADYNAHQSPVK